MTAESKVTVRLTRRELLALRACATGELEAMSDFDHESAYAQSLARAAVALDEAARKLERP